VRKKTFKCCVSLVIQSRHKKRKKRGKNMARPKGSKNKPSLELQESEPKQLTKTLYLVNYWVPFPASKYGGLQAVLALDDDECYELIKKYSDDMGITRYQNDYEELIKARIKKATRYEIKGDNPSGIVRSFTT
jgi:hypothetical protein